jgi:hypothetical protein
MKSRSTAPRHWKVSGKVFRERVQILGKSHQFVPPRDRRFRDFVSPSRLLIKLTAATETPNRLASWDAVSVPFLKAATRAERCGAEIRVHCRRSCPLGGETFGLATVLPMTRFCKSADASGIKAAISSSTLAYPNIPGSSVNFDLRALSISRSSCTKRSCVCAYSWLN